MSVSENVRLLSCEPCPPSLQVVSGSGDLEVLRLVRRLRVRAGHPEVHYGSHMATHMALGLLFIGGCRSVTYVCTCDVACQSCDVACQSCDVACQSCDFACQSCDRHGATML